MGVEQVELSHEEVWDDSALIDSWNEALAEYKPTTNISCAQKYHSVHAKGGSVKDLESKISQRAPESESNKRANSSEPVSSAGNEDPDAIISRSDQAQSSQKDATAAASAAPPPQALLGSSCSCRGITQDITPGSLKGNSRPNKRSKNHGPDPIHGNGSNRRNYYQKTREEAGQAKEGGCRTVEFLRRQPFQTLAAGTCSLQLPLPRASELDRVTNRKIPAAVVSR
ncbi:hypothetical protein MAC_01816 [Metarhizium acridum CQMa 102]|uniref:Survival Motor Neuron Gemin2-binding domain-containing protein n=1 Tax=Metarhizium acridum (strain CQMa 102) TaxID=655827 RepID=E9DW18_METAQ|nr:uncharacterized protein MAC_01816 [Metarhizium acridum CQMa 102]EFY92215.1 hypothetical protein MAC_01816 [Metarhizium acridum CQMa 102]